MEDYLNPDQLRSFKAISGDEISTEITKIEKLPTANKKALAALESAQMIVYGPGTQHSSLFPSYMTRGLADVIAGNVQAEKVFISNIGFDHDILGMSHDSIIDGLLRYMNIGAEEVNGYTLSKLVNRSIISSNGEIHLDLSTLNNSTGQQIDVSFAKWGSDIYSHDGERVSRALLTIASMNSKLFRQATLTSISIVVPVLNEIRTIQSVISQLITFDWLGEGYVPQLVIVDGGSTDGTWEYLKGVTGVIVEQNLGYFGRGAAIRKGISMAKGEIIVTFPADDEYKSQAIIDVANALKDRGLGIVFGSRSTFCIDTDARLREIYGGRTREYFFSKWGGLLLSLVSAIKYHRWVADPLTSIKGFKGLDKMEITLKGNSLDWDTRLIVDSWKKGVPIIEVPVDFKPRTIKQGKKTSLASGLLALSQLVFKPVRD